MVPEEKSSFTYEKTFKENGDWNDIQSPEQIAEEQAAQAEQANKDKEAAAAADLASAEPKEPTAAELKAQLKEWQDKAAAHEARINAIEPEITTYKTKIEELSKPTNPFEGDEDGALFYKLQQIKKSNPDLYPVLKKASLGNPDAAELWKLNFVKNNPEIKDKPEVVQRKLERTYPALFGQGTMLAPPEDKESPEYQEYQDQYNDLQLDGTRIRKEFMTALDGIKLPEVVDRTAKEAEAKASQEKIVGEWKPSFDILDKELAAKQKIEIKLDKDTMPLEMEISEAQRKKLLQGAAFLVLSQKLPNNAETMGKVKAYLKQETDAFVAEAEKLVKSALATRDEQWKKLTGGKLPIQSASAETEGKFDGHAQFSADLKKRSHH